ncbi:hypothetical protein [Stackebrandtia nassauensis]|nr:hypothetical protein [Stackebrandtia nassauensis]
MFVCVVLVGNHLGYAHAIDVGEAGRFLNRQSSWLATLTTIQVIAVVIALVITSAVAGLTATLAGVGVEAVVLGGKRPARLTGELTAMEEHFRNIYLLDVATAWPHLWLRFPAEHREQVTGNRAGIRHAATLVGWGILTSAVSVIWPIAWIAVLGLVLVGIHLMRQSISAYSQTVAVLMMHHAPELASQLGFENSGRLDRAVGSKLQYYLQGDEPPAPKA